MVELTEADVSEMRGWRHDLHRRPELGFEVNETAAFVARRLREFGFDEVHTGIGRTGVVGVLRNGAGPSIGLRADMDALPIREVGSREYRSEVDGVFHGCGHDGHTAMLLGAARNLATTRSFEGTVHFVFQPDEENGRGAAAMIDDGLFERFVMSSVFGMHNKPGMPVGTFGTRVGPMMSSEDLFQIVVVGRGGHASTPERHIDPVVVGAEIIQSLQTIVSRSVAAIDTAVVSVTEVTTDGARNIVPTTVTIRGDCRTFSAEVQQRIEQRMRDLVSGICAAHGATGTVDYSHEFVPLINTADETAIAIRAATVVAGPDKVNGDCDLVTASEDFARYLEHVPGCFIDLGNGSEGDCGSSLHNPSYDFNDDALELGTRYWIYLVREYASFP